MIWTLLSFLVLFVILYFLNITTALYDQMRVSILASCLFDHSIVPARDKPSIFYGEKAIPTLSAGQAMLSFFSLLKRCRGSNSWLDFLAGGRNREHAKIVFKSCFLSFHTCRRDAIFESEHLVAFFVGTAQKKSLVSSLASSTVKLNKNKHTHTDRQTDTHGCITV